MREEQIEKITKRVGSLDAPQLIAILESLGVGEDVILLPEAISIPKLLEKDVASLQRELSFLSKAGRLYKILEENGRIIIDLNTFSEKCILEYSESAPVRMLSSVILKTHPYYQKVKKMVH